jgi:predicted helicase
LTIIESLKGQSKRGSEFSYDPEQVKLWIYRPMSKIMQLHLSHIHSNLELTKMLLTGFDEKSSKSRFELPYSYSSHHYTILQLAVIGDCYRKNLLDQFIDDPKIIKVDEISATLERNLSLGMLPERKKELIKEKVST